VVTIDSVMHGAPGITAVYYLPAPRPAIIETSAATSVERVLAGLSAASATRLDWIVLTHIHLDHAGAVGHLAAAFPSARVVVRVEGAPHIVDPSRLWASASRLYDDMEGLWGSMEPVAAERIDAVDADGPVADLGDGRVLEAVYTPGHANHHMALYEPASGDLFAGDAIGVLLPELGAVHVATPPPEFDLEANLDSLDRLRRLRATRVFPTHFGAAAMEPDALFDQGGAALRAAVELALGVVVAGGGVADIADAMAAVEAEAIPLLVRDHSVADRLSHTTSYELNGKGIARYLTKRRGIPVGP